MGSGQDWLVQKIGLRRLQRLDAIKAEPPFLLLTQKTGLTSPQVWAAVTSKTWRDKSRASFSPPHSTNRFDESKRLGCGDFRGLTRLKQSLLFSSLKRKTWGGTAGRVSYFMGKSLGTLLHFWGVFQFTQAQPLPSPHKQCWTRVSRIFSKFQLCIGWGKGELQLGIQKWQKTVNI